MVELEEGEDGVEKATGGSRNNKKKELVSIESKETEQFDFRDRPSPMTLRRREAWRRVTRPFRVDPALIPAEPFAFTCKFMRDRQDVFQIDDERSFFGPAQRSRIVYGILSKTPFPEVVGRGEKSERREARGVGIDALLAKGTYDDAFPLHDGEESDERPEKGGEKTEEADGPIDYSAMPDRRRLYLAWGTFSQFYKEQPLNFIRGYFGEKIAIYFAWLGFYTTALIPVAFLGIFAVVYGVAKEGNDGYIDEICDRGVVANLTMCPLCRGGFCPYWRLQDSCDYTKVTVAMDNSFTVFFAFVMSVWTVGFLELWKRKQAELTFLWDLEDLEDEEVIRADYEAESCEKRKNPISGTLEPFFPEWRRIPRYVTSVCVVLLAVGCVLIAIVGVIAYRSSMRFILYNMEDDSPVGAAVPGVDDLRHRVKTNSKIFVTASAALINLVVIMSLNKFYYFLALKLTKLETQRTDKDYEDSFTVKMFCFQFVNFYASIFYIAFFKGRFWDLFDNDENHVKTSPARYDQCDPAGCFIELTIQMFIIMVGKQMVSNIQEFLIPKLVNLYRERQARKSEEDDDEGKKQKKKKKKEEEEEEKKMEEGETREQSVDEDKRSISLADLPQWERDYALVKNDELGLFNEYLEMVIQFGFVTLFVAAFPLAPFFALVNNVIEIRLDANKFTSSLRRQRPIRVKNIGAWFGILNSLAYFAVVVNGLVIAFTSNTIERLIFRATVSQDGSLRGFAKYCLSEFSVDDFNNETRPEDKFRPPGGVCYYRDFRAGPSQDYERTKEWYHVMMAKVAFVLIFEHVIMLLRDVIAWCVPDVPRGVTLSIKKETYWVQKALYGRELAEEAKNIKKSK